jgi:transposase-like protein
MSWKRTATTFFERALGRGGHAPTDVITDRHEPYVKAIPAVLPDATHVRTGLRRANGETTRCIARRHSATRDRLRPSRGVKTLATGQRFFEGFEAVQALYHGHVCWQHGGS